MSVFYGLDTEAYDREYSDTQLIRRILTYFKPHLKRVAAIGLFISISSGFNAVQTLVVSRCLYLLAESQTLGLLIGIVVAVLLVGVGNWLVNWARRRFPSSAARSTLSEGSGAAAMSRWWRRVRKRAGRELSTPADQDSKECQASRLPT